MSQDKASPSAYWPATAAALVTFGALYAVSPSPILIGLMVALLATHFTPARFTGGVIMKLLLRVVVYGIIITLARQRAGDDQFFLFDPAPRPAVGEIFAAEYVLHRWHQAAPIQAVTVITTGFVLLAAANSREDTLIRLFPFIAPLYFLLIARALRGYRPRVPARVRGRGAVTALLLRGSAVAVALALGAMSVQLVWAFRGELTDLGSQLLRERHFREVTGMSSTPRLGRTFDLQGSPQRVLRIENFVGDPHLRGVSFTEYRGGEWAPGVRAREYLPLDASALQPSASGESMTVTTLGRVNRFHFVPLNALGAEFAPGEPMDWSPVHGGPIRTKEVDPLPYTVTVGGSEVHQGPLAVALTPQMRERALQLPDRFSPEVRALASRIAASQESAPEKIEAVVSYLITNHGYSLTTDPGPGDPVTNFLLQKKDAHCEYFGSAAVLLMRCLGIPARYVTGFYAHESGEPGITVVRQRDAHAWAEAWVDGVGWVTVDATPGDGRPSSLWEDVSRGQKMWEWVQDRWMALRLWLEARTATQQIAALVAIGVLLLLARVWQIVRSRRPPASRPFVYAGSDAALAELAARFETVLRRRGVALPSGQTWRETLDTARHGDDSARPLDPGLVEGARTFVAHYNAARFGGSMDRETYERLREELQRLEAEPAGTAKS